MIDDPNHSSSDKGSPDPNQSGSGEPGSEASETVPSNLDDREGSNGLEDAISGPITPAGNEANAAKSEPEEGDDTDENPAPTGEIEKRERELHKQRLRDRKQVRKLRGRIVKKILKQAEFWVRAVLVIIAVSMFRIQFELGGVSVGPITLSDNVLIALVGGIGIYALFARVVKSLFPDPTSPDSEDSRH